MVCCSSTSCASQTLQMSCPISSAWQMLVAWRPPPSGTASGRCCRTCRRLASWWLKGMPAQTSWPAWTMQQRRAWAPAAGTPRRARRQQPRQCGRQRAWRAAAQVQQALHGSSSSSSGQPAPWLLACRGA